MRIAHAQDDGLSSKENPSKTASDALFTATREKGSEAGTKSEVAEKMQACSGRWRMSDEKASSDRRVPRACGECGHGPRLFTSCLCRPAFKGQTASLPASWL